MRLRTCSVPKSRREPLVSASGDVRATSWPEGRSTPLQRRRSACLYGWRYCLQRAQFCQVSRQIARSTRDRHKIVWHFAADSHNSWPPDSRLARDLTEPLKGAERIGADLIVVGAHQPSNLMYLLGSNAAAIVRHAT